MTVEDFIVVLQGFPKDLQVKTFCPFDGNGPCTWEEPVLSVDGGELRIDCE